jgi:nucleotidyltransferase substrate binding protein (TIGR01987 family)
MNDKLPRLLAALDSAVTRLAAALARPKDEFVRDSAIQRFEFTFELLWKALKTYAVDAGLESYSPRESLRCGFQLGLIANDPLWFQMLEDRNLTSHTYNEATAEAIYSRLGKYLPAIREALAELRRRAGS